VALLAQGPRKAFWWLPGARGAALLALKARGLVLLAQEARERP